MRTHPVRVPTPYPWGRTASRRRWPTSPPKFPGPPGPRSACPGHTRHGVVDSTPHYVTKSGPRSKVDPVLVEAWANFDVRSALSAAFGVPTLVLNDAEVHGAGVVAGTGLELVLTLGTGLGCAVFDGGTLAPHMELSQAPVRWGLSYDTYIGEVERRRLGNAFWSRRARAVVEALRPVFLWDRLYIGGGNSRRMPARPVGADGRRRRDRAEHRRHRRWRARLVSSATGLTRARPAARPGAAPPARLDQGAILRRVAGGAGVRGPDQQVARGVRGVHELHHVDPVAVLAQQRGPQRVGKQVGEPLAQDAVPGQQTDGAGERAPKLRGDVVVAARRGEHPPAPHATARASASSVAVSQACRASTSPPPPPLPPFPPRAGRLPVHRRRRRS